MRPHRPDVRRAGWLLALAAAGAIAAQSWLQLTYRAVRAPVPLVVYGLETDPGVLRGWFEQLMTQGTYLLLIRTEAVDLTWAAALGATIICLVRFVGAAGWERRPRLAPLLVAWAPLFAIGPLFDLVENAFSLAMLTDPYGFPDWWALAHGVCARLKFGLAVLAGSIGVGSTIVIALPRSGRPAGGAAPLTSP